MVKKLIDLFLFCCYKPFTNMKLSNNCEASTEWKFFNAIISIINGLLITYILYLCWNWFIFPSFHIDNPGFWMLYGIKLTHGLFTFRSLSENEMRSQLLVKKLTTKDKSIVNCMIHYQKWNQSMMFVIYLLIWLNLYAISLIVH